MAMMNQAAGLQLRAFSYRIRAALPLNFYSVSLRSSCSRIECRRGAQPSIIVRATSSSSTSSSSSAMATSTPISNPTRVVEHIVLFKVKEGVSEWQSEAMVSGLRSLKSIDTVVELSAGPALKVFPGSFTHALHCRYKNKEDLASYANHPFHLEVISKYIAPIVEERLAVDWEADVHEPTLQSDYAAVSLALLKPKDNLETDKLSSIVHMLQQYKNKFPAIKQVSVGKNFSPARAKGFEWGFLSVLSSLQELEDLTEEHISLLNSSVKPEMQDLIVMDYSVA